MKIYRIEQTKVASLLLMIFIPAISAAAKLPVLTTAVAEGGGATQTASYDGVVEAIRQTVMAAQVAGAIVELKVKAGDRVAAGQLLVRLDARAADQTAAASQAQVTAARATLDVANKDFNRQKQLFEKRFISQAALDQAEAVYKSTEAQVAVQIAQTAAARSQSDFAVIRAPYPGIVADVSVVLGDMALPGRPLLMIYDPGGLRVTAYIPQSADTKGVSIDSVRVEIPALPAQARMVVPTNVQILPTADASTQSLQLRLDLPAGIKQLIPGMFARAWLPAQPAAASDSTVRIPSKAVVRRAEMTGVYVVNADGQPVLRQVRIGRSINNTTEILAGISAGERVATEPQMAATLVGKKNK